MQKGHIIPVIRPKIFAGFGKQALLMGAGPLGQLLFTGRKTEIGRRPAHIVDISLKIRLLGEKPGFR